MLDLLYYLEEFNTVSIMVRLVLATLLGGIIGIERANRRHAAGLRTFALVCLGAALATITNLYLWETTGSADVSRIPAGVVSGVGFLGVGTIIVTNRNHVKGLTTAAGLWATATLGMAIGSGMIYASIFAFLMIMITITLLQRISRYQDQYNRILGLYLEVDNDCGVEQLLEFIHEKGYIICNIEKKKEEIMNKTDVVILLELDLKGRHNHTDIIHEFSNLKEVNYLEEVKG